LVFINSGEVLALDSSTRLLEVKHIILPPVVSKKLVILYTDFGNITFAFYPEVAPNHVKQIFHLVQLGVYDRTHFYRIEPGFVAQIDTVQNRSLPLTQEQNSAIRPLKAEFSDLKHKKGILSMAHYDGRPNSAETSFSILLGDAPHLDKKYTIFGHVVSGFDTIKKMQQIPRNGTAPIQRIEIIKTEVVKDIPENSR